MAPTPCPAVLTIAGSDPSGGAGLQADLKTFHQHGVYGMSVVTLLTVQNTVGVGRVVGLEVPLVLEQLEAVLSDIPPVAAKTGALGSHGLVSALAERARHFPFPLIVDPVMVSKHGHALVDDATAAAVREHLLPLAEVITPNRFEAERLTGIAITDQATARQACHALKCLGPKHVLLKCGELSGRMVTMLESDSGVVDFTTAPVPTPHTHGAGCILSAAITANLARGLTVEQAAWASTEWVAAAIASAPGLGGGNGPLQTLTPVARGPQ
jgi:hydroxymethylpyrimidine/phosphomethylpyrimidine kinase